LRWPPAWELVTLSKELIMGQSPAGRNVSSEAEGIVAISQQVTSGEDTAD
jgi:hypothetical protein